MFAAGKLTPAQAAYWKPKPAEELYDLRADPDEVVNLAADPNHSWALNQLRTARGDLAVQIRDVGFLPEGELHSRPGRESPYDWARGDGRAAVARAVLAADVATGDPPEAVFRLRLLVRDDDPAVQYWGVTGMLIRGKLINANVTTELRDSLADPSPHVRVVAAETLARYGSEADRRSAVGTLLELANGEKQGVFVAVAALNALEAAGIPHQAVCDAVKRLPTKLTVPDARYEPYVARLIEDFPARGK
jgi:uncharacterized sulfatase